MNLELKPTQKEEEKDIETDNKDKPNLKKFKEGDEKSHLARIYRTFSNKKYLKFRHQFPRMRQTEIINRIIREWQALSMEEKLKLGETYNQKEMYDSQEDDIKSNFALDSRSEEHKISDNQVPKRKSEIKDDKIVLQQDHKKSKKAQMVKIKVEDSQSSLNDLEIKDQQDDQEEDSQNSSPQKRFSKTKIKKQIGVKAKKTTTKKSKPIKKPQDYIKLKNGEYILFYKHYYARLQSQHPKWSSTQLDHIIRLLWKKKQQQQKKVKKERIKQEKSHRLPIKPRRPISGKELFTLQKKKDGLSKEEIDYLWKQLPRESKNDWIKRALQLGSHSQQMENALESTTKSELSLKTQSGSKKAKNVISFRDALLKGIVSKQSQDTKSILEENNESLKKQMDLKKEKNHSKIESQSEKNKKQDFEYVSLTANPLGFMRNKITLEKIILE